MVSIQKNLRAQKRFSTTARLLIVLFCGLLVNGAIADEPIIPKGKGEFCVAPTEVMRKEHMDMLLHQRDQTVYDGIRSKQHSLKGCIDCHLQTNDNNEYIPIDAPGQFCATCHEFASVKLDCFECHRTTPDEALSAMHSLNSDQITAMSFAKEKDMSKTPFHQSDTQYRQLMQQLLAE